MTTAERLQRVEREHPVVPITRQCAWLGVPRSSVYYQGKPAVSEDDLALMKRLDTLHTQHPFLGSRRLRDRLVRDGVFVNRKRIQRLMRVMGIETLYPKRKTSARGPGHRIYPYLLRGLAITRPNQVWCADTTYIPMARGFCYLVAIMDWATRAVLSWRLATTLEADSCVEALEEALERFGAPQIFNTDQGSQFTSEAFTGVLKAHTIDISMDGKGCWKTTCSSSGCGALSNTRRCISRPTNPCPRLAPLLLNTSTSIIMRGLIRPWIDGHRGKPTPQRPGI